MSFFAQAVERHAIASSGALAAHWGDTVDYPHVRQDARNWCWAACTAMVAEKRSGSAVTQCSIVCYQRSSTACCDDPTPATCDVPLSVSAMVGLLQRYGHAAARIALPSASVLRQQLQGAAVVVMWKWNDTSAGPAFHYVLVSGRVPGTDEYQLHDPRFDDVSYVTFDALRTAGALGRWIAAWWVRA